MQSWKKIGLSGCGAFLLAASAMFAQVTASGSARARVTAPADMAQVPAMLEGGLSSASAHAGQAVVARLANSARLPDGTTLPQGSELLGRLTEVKSLAGSNSVSKLGVLFDQVRMPNGQVSKVRSLLQGIGPANGTATPVTGNAGAQSTAYGASSESSDGTHTPAGGAVGGLLGGVTGAVGSVADTAGATVKGTLGAATGLPGVLLSQAGTASGVLQSKGREVEVPSGARLSLAVSATK